MGRLITALDRVPVVFLLRLVFIDVGGFLGHIAGVVVILPGRLLARLLLVRVLLFAIGHTPLRCRDNSVEWPKFLRGAAGKMRPCLKLAATEGIISHAAISRIRI